MAFDISRAPLFATLGKSQRDELLKQAQTITFRAGDILYRAGDLNTNIFLVTSGTLAQTEPRTRAPFGWFAAGSMWGQGNMAQPSLRYTYQIAADTDGTATLIKLTAVARFIERDPALGATLLANCLRVQAERCAQREEVLSLIAGLKQLLHEGGVSPFVATLEYLRSFFKVHKALIVRFDATGSTMHIEHAIGYDKAHLRSVRSLASDTVLSRVYTSRRPLLINADTFERIYSIVPYCSHNMLAVPLSAGTQVYGAVLLAEPLNAPFTSIAAEMLFLAVSPLSALLVCANSAKESHHDSLLKRSYVSAFRSSDPLS